jgi:hypothetical protein
MTWEHGWPERLRERIAELGLGSVHEFARAHQGIPMDSLVEILGGGFAPIQVAVAMGLKPIETGGSGGMPRTSLSELCGLTALAVGLRRRPAISYRADNAPVPIA